jgi:nitrogen regulatory protein P-II 1
MKLITAMVRPEMLNELIGVVVDNGGHGLTVTEVRGFGRQFGDLASGTVRTGLRGNRKAALLPKIRLDILVLDDDAEAMMEAIAKHARTEIIGDGKIWITTVDAAMRVRTGERGRDAVQGKGPDS